MAFSQLLLVAANSKKYIEGERGDRLIIGSKPPTNTNNNLSNPDAGEIILCFQLDDRKDKKKARLIADILGIIDADSRCDGLIFYAQDNSEEKTICLVEMKSTDIDKVPEQIITTRKHVKELLTQQCGPHCSKFLSHIKWKACFFHYGSAPDQKVDAIKDELKKNNFVDIDDFTYNNADAGNFLRGTATTREVAKRHKSRKRP